MRFSAVVLLVIVAAGCGGAGTPGNHVARPGVRQTHCTGSTSAQTFVCGYPLGSAQSSIWTGPGSDRMKVTGPARVVMVGSPAKVVKGADPVGFWVPNRIFLSPDGRTLLAQWSGECESQSTYLVPRAGGKPRLVFLSESRALGWSKDGRARVLLAEQGAFDGERGYHQGTYLVDPVTMKRTLVRPVETRHGC